MDPEKIWLPHHFLVIFLENPHYSMLFNQSINTTSSSLPNRTFLKLKIGSGYKTYPLIYNTIKNYILARIDLSTIYKKMGISRSFISRTR